MKSEINLASEDLLELATLDWRFKRKMKSEINLNSDDLFELATVEINAT